MHTVPDNLDPSAVAVFLDVDGTLVEIRDSPTEVVADAELVRLLEACRANLGGALSLVSGRSVAEVDRIFAPAVFAVAGAHGAELRIDKEHGLRAMGDGLPDAAERALKEFADRHQGLLLEIKRSGASLHYRMAPRLQQDCQQMVTTLLGELGGNFRLIAGKMVYELAPATYNKGVAIRRVLEDTRFAGRQPLFVGDDITDEDGFRAVNELQGISIRVGGRSNTVAQYSLQDVAAVRNWLPSAILGSR